MSHAIAIVPRLQSWGDNKNLIKIDGAVRGDSAGYRMREAAAIAWAVDELAETDLADDVQKARAIVANRPPEIRP